MAELAISIAGLAFAWKGVIDFGELIMKLLDDDTSQREGLAIKLGVSQHMLKDWGAYWGIDTPDGRFHTFEVARKELIFQIIFRLSFSRKKAFRKLKDRYGISIDWGNEDYEQTSNSSERITKVMDKIKSMAKRGKEKSLWVILDKALVTNMVTETFELHQCLNSLTFMSTPFLVANITTLHSAQPLESSIAYIEANAKRQQSILGTSQHISSPIPDTEIDGKTLAGLTTRSIISSEQADTLQKLIDEALDKHGDSRLIEKIAMWWNDDVSKLLVLEGSDDADDKTSTYACVLLYHLVSCQKLIYVLKVDYTDPPNHQFEDMLRTLIRSLITSHSDIILETLQLSNDVLDGDSGGADQARSQELVDVTIALLKDTIGSSNRRLILIIDGWENLTSPSTVLASSMQSFVLGLRTLCIAKPSFPQPPLKILLACKGHAAFMYNFVNVENVVDLTDHASQTSILSQELAVSLREDSG